MSAFDTVVYLIYLAAAVCFVLGLHLMNSPVTARRGNQLSAAGMIAAIAATFAALIHFGTVTITGWIVLLAGMAVGAAAGLYSARTVKMTAMPQLVSLFNAVGGGAACIVAINDFVKIATGPGSPNPAGVVAVATALDVLIGAVTFTGSLIAAGKLQGWVSGAPITFPGSRVVTAVLAVLMVGAGIWLMTGTGTIAVLIVLLLAALGFGITMVLPIGGADMPVVISLLNAFTGLAAATTGFVLSNDVLIVSGAVVFSAGAMTFLPPCVTTSGAE